MSLEEQLELLKKTVQHYAYNTNIHEHDFGYLARKTLLRIAPDTRIKDDTYHEAREL